MAPIALPRIMTPATKRWSGDVEPPRAKMPPASTHMPIGRHTRPPYLSNAMPMAGCKAADSSVAYAQTWPKRPASRCRSDSTSGTVTLKTLFWPTDLSKRTTAQSASTTQP
eukprot:5381098-Prymnesium_polylepis.2